MGVYLGTPYGALWRVRDGVGGHGWLHEECGEAIPVMGAICGPLGRVRVGDARPGNIVELVDLVMELCQMCTPLIHYAGGPVRASYARHQTC